MGKIQGRGRVEKMEVGVVDSGEPAATPSPTPKKQNKKQLRNKSGRFRRVGRDGTGRDGTGRG